MDDFDGKVVLVTGAASGFGKRLAERLVERGARLVLGDIDRHRLEEVHAALGRPAVAADCDVTSETEMGRLCKLAERAFGRLDIAVNNAGAVTAMKSLLDTTAEDFDRSIAVNARSVLFGMKHQIPLMLTSGGGTILNVASLAGLAAAPKLAAYCAAKHAVVGLTRTAAIEFARQNIRVNAICPSYSPTPLVTKSNIADRLEQLERGVPMKRLGTPEEIVSTMLTLLNPQNTYLTGQAIAVDGGISAL